MHLASTIALGPLHSGGPRVTQRVMELLLTPFLTLFQYTLESALRFDLPVRLLARIVERVGGRHQPSLKQWVLPQLMLEFITMSAHIL